MAKISIAGVPEEDIQQPVSIDDGSDIPEPTVVAKRAGKASYGLSDVLPEKSFDDYLNAIGTGQENKIRDAAASVLNNRKSQTHIGQLVDMISGSNFSNEELKQFNELNRPIPTDPRSVIEDQFGSKLLYPTMIQAKSQDEDSDHWTKQAYEDHPEIFEGTYSAGSEYMGHRETLSKILDNLGSTVKAQDYQEYNRQQFLQGNIPLAPGNKDYHIGPVTGIPVPLIGTLYTQARIRSAVNQVMGQDYGEVWPPSKMFSKLRFDLMNLHNPEFNDKVEGLYELLKDNPSLAQQFFYRLKGASTDEENQNNIGTILDLAIGPYLTANLIKRAGRIGAERTVLKGLEGDLSGAVADINRQNIVTSNITQNGITTAAGNIKVMAEGLAPGTGILSPEEIVRRIKDTQANENIPEAFRQVPWEGNPWGLSDEAMAKYGDQLKEGKISIEDLLSGNVIKPRAQTLINGEVIGQIKGAIKDIAANQDTVEAVPHAVAIPAINGNLEEAGTAAAAIQATPNPAKPLQSMPSVFQQAALELRNNPGNFGQEIANRIADNTSEIEARLNKTLSTSIRVDRAPAVFHSPEGRAAIEDVVRDRYPELRNRIINVLLPDWNSTINIHTIDTIIGNKTGGYFPNKASAKMSSTFMGIEGSTIENAGAGTGWYIRVRRPVSEVDDVFRDLLLSHPDTIGPESQLDVYMGALNGRSFASPEALLDMANLGNRKVAAYVPNELRNLYKDAASSISELLTESPIHSRIVQKTTKPLGVTTPLWTKTVQRQWLSTVKLAQDMYDPVTKQKGYSFKNLAELEYHYANQWKRLPTELEAKAYFAFMDALNIDYSLRDMAMVRGMMRLGAEEYKFQVWDPKAGQAHVSPMVHAIRQPTLPGGDHAILAPWEQLGQERVLYPPGTRKGSNSVALKTWKDLQQRVEKGELKVFRLVHPEYYPYREYGKGFNDRIDYVLTKNAISSPVKTGILPRRGGGHLEYDYKVWGKQAIVNPVAGRGGVAFAHWYEGDRTGMGFETRVQANDWAREMNEVRKLIANRQLPAARRYHSTPGRMIGVIPWKDLRSDFFPKRDANTGKVNPARWNLTEPFMAVDKDKTILDSPNDMRERYKDTFRDGTKEGSPSRQLAIPFTQPRDSFDIMTIQNEGTRYNPVYRYSPADTVDPTTVLNRALNRIIDSTYLDDLKITSIEHWIEAATHAYAGVDDKGFPKYVNYLEPGAGGVNSFKHSPQYHFYNGKFLSGTPKEIQNRLENQRYAIKQMVGLQNETVTSLNAANQKLLDAAYANIGASFGRTILGKTQLGLAQDMHTMQDVPKFMRAAAFHTVMFGNPTQLLTQSMSWLTIGSVVHPLDVVKTMTAAALHQISRINESPRMLAALDKLATRFGWERGQWLEARNILMNSGFRHVMGEHQVLQSGLESKVIEYNATKFLNAGNFFFKGAERNARFGSWYGSYLMHRRDVGSLQTLGNPDHIKILQQAARMMGDMDSASKSRLQNGIMEFPLQFMSWNMRFAGMMVGKPLSALFGGNSRLTWGQWSRTFATYAVAFGGISGLAAVTGLSPFQFMMRKYADENGYVVGENFWKSAAMEGAFSALGAVLTGQGDHKQGYWFNFGDRYSQGISLLTDLMQSDNSVFSMFAGATGSTFEAAWKQSGNLRMALMSSLKNDGEFFPLMADDVVDAASILSVVNKANQAIYAAQTGKWLSRSGNYISDVSPKMAAFMFATGLQPQQQSDVFNKTKTLEDWKETEKQAQKQHQLVFHRYLDALRRGEPDQAAQYGKQAQAFLQFIRSDNWSRAVQQSLDSYSRNLIDTINEEMYLKAAPDSTRQMYLKAFQEIKQLEKAKQ